MKNRPLAGILTALLTVAAVSDARAGTDFGIGAGIEVVTLEEFGIRDETGGRFALTFTLDNFNRTGSGVIWGVLAKAYVGKLDHSDESGVVSSVKGGSGTGLGFFSSTQHLGGVAEFWAGYRNGGFWEDTDLDLLVGIGAESLKRDVSAGFEDGTANLVLSEEIRHDVAWVSLAAGAFTKRGQWDNHLRAGLKFPVFAEVDWSIQAAPIDHGKSPSLFVRASFDYAPGGEREYGIFVYYDSLRMNDGPAGAGGVPSFETAVEIYGAGMAWYF